MMQALFDHGFELQDALEGAFHLGLDGVFGDV